MDNPLLIHVSEDTEINYTIEVRGFDSDDEMEVNISDEDGWGETMWLSRDQARALYQAIAFELGDF